MSDMKWSMIVPSKAQENHARTNGSEKVLCAGVLLCAQHKKCCVVLEFSGAKTDHGLHDSVSQGICIELGIPFQQLYQTLFAELLTVCAPQFGDSISEQQQPVAWSEIDLLVF